MSYADLAVTCTCHTRFLQPLMSCFFSPCTLLYFPPSYLSTFSLFHLLTFPPSHPFVLFCTFHSQLQLLSPVPANCFAGHFPCLSHPSPPTFDSAPYSDFHFTFIPHISTIWEKNPVKNFILRKYVVERAEWEVGCANKSGRSWVCRPATATHSSKDQTIFQGRNFSKNYIF